MNSIKALIFLSCLTGIYGAGGVVDMITGVALTKPWLSTGTSYLSTREWTSLESDSSYSAKSADSSIVLMSLPNIGGPYADANATAVRIKNVQYGATTGKVSFEAKVYVPNDTFCSKTWSTPQHIDSLEITFLVVDKGAFILRDEYTFFVGDGKLNRTTANLKNSSNWFYFNFPTGCTYGWNNPADACRFNKTQPVDKIGAIATLQTLVHDTYLLLRVHTTQRSRVGVILTPHDSFNQEYFESFGAHETAGFLAFPTGINLTCFEGIQFETRSFHPITSSSFSFNYRNVYPVLPAVFGMLVTQNSFTDSTAVRVFARTMTSAKAITQEDQCAEQQVEHTTAERATLFVFSARTAGTGDCCFSNMCDPTLAPTTSPTVAPTYAPSPVPTVACTDTEYEILLMDLFSDGWHNIDILITVDGVTRNYTMDCTNCTGTLKFNSSSCELDISMTADGRPITPWEVRWLIKHNNVTYVGGWGSELTIRGNAVTGTGMLNYDPHSKDNKCEECPHPKPKPAPGSPGGSKDDDNKSNSNSTDSGAGGPGPGPAAPKPKPPAKVRIDIYDERENGWFDGRGEFTGVCDDELCMGSTDNTCALDVPDAPDILTYPKYYIMNEEKTKLIHSATICKDRGIDLCEEVMPYDGHFYFRLAGIEPIGDKATWKFCDREGGIDTELEFRMKKGHCIPMAQTTAKKYCDGLETVTTISATIFLTGATATDLSAADSRLLEDDMSALIPLAERVTLTGWQYTEGSGVQATFEAVFVSQSKAMTHDVVQNAIQTIRNELEVGMTSGSFVSELKNAINLVPNSADDVLRKVDGASLLEVDIATEYYQPIGTGLYVTSPDQDTIPSSTTEHHEQGTDSTVSSTVIVFAGGVAGVVLAAAAFMVFNKRTTHTLLPNDSTH